MTRKLIRGLIIGGVAALLGLSMVGESRGFFGLFERRWNATTAMYGTVCNPCGQQLTCNYVPQTCYRVQYATVPVTTYRPVTSCDPCTGCQTTCMKPTTCYTQQARYVPYTSYRLVYTPTQPACAATTSYYAPTAACATGGCATGGCAAPGYAVTTNYAPAATAVVGPTATAVTSYAAPIAGPAPMVAPAPAAGCSSCNAGAATTSYYTPYTATPTTSYYAPTAPRAVPATPNPVYAYSTTQGFEGSYQYAPQAGVPASSYQSNYRPSTTPTYAAPSYAAPSNATPSYAAPSYAPSSAAPSYSGPTYTNPGSYATPAMPLPATSSAPAASLNGTVITQAPAVTVTSQYAPSPAPIVTTTPGLPTLAPQQSPTRVDRATTDVMKPIPDPLMSQPQATPTPAPQPAAPKSTAPQTNGPSFGPTSMPRLVDPQDRTAAAWPTERAWSYSVVGATLASRDVVTPIATISEPTPIAQPVAHEAPRNDGWQPAKLGPIEPARKSTDADGWRSTSR